MIFNANRNFFLFFVFVFFFPPNIIKYIGNGFKNFTVCSAKLKLFLRHTIYLFNDFLMFDIFSDTSICQPHDLRHVSSKQF